GAPSEPVRVRRLPPARPVGAPYGLGGSLPRLPGGRPPRRLLGAPARAVGRRRRLAHGRGSGRARDRSRGWRVRPGRAPHRRQQRPDPRPDARGPPGGPVPPPLSTAPAPLEALEYGRHLTHVNARPALSGGGATPRIRRRPPCGTLRGS